MKDFSAIVLRKIQALRPEFSLLPYDDALQECRIACWQHENNLQGVFRTASKRLYRLFADLGFSRKKGKDQFQVFYNEIEFTDAERQALNQIERWYLDHDLTADQIAKKLQIEPTLFFKKALGASFPKKVYKKHQQNKSS